MKRRILNFENFLLESNKFSSINEQLDLNAIPSSELQKIIDTDMKSYLKKMMWNKSIEVFYGKDYKGNPTEDKGEVYTGAWFSGHDKHTMGEFFLDAWAETNQFCDRVVELVETGEISDTWKSIGKTVGWGALGAAVVAGVIFTGGGLLGMMAPVAGATFTAGGAAALATGLGTNTVVLGGLGTVIWNIKGSLDEEEFKKLSPEVVNVLNMINDKEGTISNFKSEIERHSDFEADWGLDRWLPAIQGMPGWSKSSWAKIGAENLGYSFSYWISYYAYQYLQAKFGASVTLAAKNIQTQQASQPVQPVQPVQPNVQPTASTTSTPTTTTEPTTTATPSGGVMGAAQPKQYNIVVDDSTVANYDL